MSYFRPIFDATVVGAQLAGQISGRTLVQLKGLKAQIAGAKDSKMKSVPAGTREEAIAFLRDWFENQVESYLKICDQYFAPADLGILVILRSAKPGCTAEILTSRKHQPMPPSGMALEDVYRSHWTVHISDQSPLGTGRKLRPVQRGGLLAQAQPSTERTTRRGDKR
jgi:hypothetical protein